MYIVSFVDFVPEPRFDGISWRHVEISEAPAENGPYTLIDTLPISVDADPAHPAARSFTTSNATLFDGWYQITFTDLSSNRQPTTPIHRQQDLLYRPTLKQVGEIVLGRTVDDVGVTTGTFTKKTNPTDDLVEALIDRSIQELAPQIGTQIPADLRQDAARAVALRTAMWIELTCYSAEVAQNRSAYPEYKTLFDEAIPKLVNQIQAEESGEDPSDVLSDNKAQYSFPSSLDFMDRPM